MKIDAKFILSLASKSLILGVENTEAFTLVEYFFRPSANLY